jgi:hypothetical protein
MAMRLNAADSALNHTWVRARHRNASGERYRGMMDDDLAERGAACRGPAVLLRKIVQIGMISLEVNRAGVL